MEQDLMAKVASAAVDIARNIKPSQYDLPTPCAEYDVRALINHFTHWSAIVLERTARKLPPPTDGSEDESTDYAAKPDWPDFFATHVDRSIAAWAEPGAWEGETVMASSPMPARTIGTMMTAELALHGWDLAAATGQAYTLPDDVAADLLRTVESMADMARQWGAFGPEVGVPADAPALDRALALSGRDPGWRP
ncbi:MULTISPECIES: TIGR03086 family metal-binding protein [Actinokineospora]|uniref:TIGR03086 family protein n=1 Tax=Actinokineospora fastidiosa TaxID=1816 RepID=A0A918LFT4_9PSEU|nr:MULTISPECIES: TIGR03086 family metal-binding protein [Actinokineospora]GGS41039.1 TIGR03086 family protein [Actinokineospora fastidiosa]